MTTTVITIDDQRTTRLGLTPMIGKAGDLQAIAQIENEQSALDQLAETGRWRIPWLDVILMDARMPILNGINTTAAITREHPGVKALMLTTYDQDDYAFGVLGAGVSGFLLKDTRTIDLHQILRAVVAGDAILTLHITWQLLERYMPYTITPRQYTAQKRLRLLAPRGHEVMGFIARGMINARVGERLLTQPESVKGAVTRILMKFQFRDWVQLVIILCDVQPPH